MKKLSLFLLSAFLLISCDESPTAIKRTSSSNPLLGKYTLTPLNAGSSGVTIEIVRSLQLINLKILIYDLGGNPWVITPEYDINKDPWAATPPPEETPLPQALGSFTIGSIDAPIQNWQSDNLLYNEGAIRKATSQLHVDITSLSSAVNPVPEGINASVNFETMEFTITFPDSMKTYFVGGTYDMKKN